MLEKLNDMDELLIVFIEPKKFAELSGEKLRNLIVQYNRATKRTTYLENNSQVLYLLNDNTTDKGAFDTTRANEVCAVLIPDEYQRIDPNSLTKSLTKFFKILHHNPDHPHNLQSDLRFNPFFQGAEQISEATNTIYGELGKAIENDNFVDVVKSIYEEIENFNPILEAKLELLHQCIFPANRPKKEKIPSFVKGAYEKFEDKVTNIKTENGSELAWNNSDYIKALRELRDSLLNS
jgi:hypothetical protein